MYKSCILHPYHWSDIAFPWIAAQWGEKEGRGVTHCWLSMAGVAPQSQTQRHSVTHGSGRNPEAQGHVTHGSGVPWGWQVTVDSADNAPGSCGIHAPATYRTVPNFVLLGNAFFASTALKTLKRNTVKYYSSATSLLQLNLVFFGLFFPQQFIVPSSKVSPINLHC